MVVGNWSIKAVAIRNLSFWVVFGSQLKCSWHYGQGYHDINSELAPLRLWWSCLRNTILSSTSMTLKLGCSNNLTIWMSVKHFKITTLTSPAFCVRKPSYLKLNSTKPNCSTVTSFYKSRQCGYVEVTNDVQYFWGTIRQIRSGSWAIVFDQFWQVMALSAHGFTISKVTIFRWLWGKIILKQF